MTHPPVFIDPSSGKPWVAWFASGTPPDLKRQWKTEGGEISPSIKGKNITHFFSMKKHEKKIRRLLDTNQTILYHPSWIKDSVSVHFAKPLGHYVLEDHSFVDEEAEKNPRKKSKHFPRFQSPEKESDEPCTTVQRTRGPRSPPIRTALNRRLCNRSHIDLTIEEQRSHIDLTIEEGRSHIDLTIEEEPFIAQARRIDHDESRSDVQQGSIVSLVTHSEEPVRNRLDRNARPGPSSLTPESPSEILQQPSNSLPGTVSPVNHTRNKAKRKIDDDDFFEPDPPEMIDIEDDFFAKTGTYTGDGLLERAIDLSARLLEGDTRYRAVMKKAAI